MPKSATEIGLKQAENFANANDDDVVRECMRFLFCVCVSMKGGGTGGAARQASERRFMSGSVCSYISAVIIDINSRLTDRQSD